MGQQPNTEAWNPDFIPSQYDAAAFDVLRLSEHFSRLAAWRKAERLPPARNPRQRRLSREAVMSLHREGVSVEQMEEHLATTSQAIQAASARWDGKPVTYKLGSDCVLKVRAIAIGWQVETGWCSGGVKHRALSN